MTERQTFALMHPVTSDAGGWDMLETEMWRALSDQMDTKESVTALAWSSFLMIVRKKSHGTMYLTSGETRRWQGYARPYWCLRLALGAPTIPAKRWTPGILSSAVRVSRESLSNVGSGKIWRRYLKNEMCFKKWLSPTEQGMLDTARCGECNA